MSLCAGLGGADLGLRLALGNARTVCYLENEVTAVQVLVARMEDGTLDSAPVWTDLKTFDGGRWRGAVDILTAGYPCQPFSCAGKQRGADDPRHLWPHVARIIGEVQPAICFFENVENHLRIGYEQVRGELYELGYQVEEGIFSAQEVGAPHLRKRLFILAYRADYRHELRSRVPTDRQWPVSPERGARSGQAGRRGQPQRRGRELADADSELIRVAGRGPHQRTGSRSAGALFPPGPGDIDGWRKLLAIDPSLEPAIRGGADGLSARLEQCHSSRTDRLRLLGNAVVPLSAAVAFSVLRERAYRSLNADSTKATVFVPGLHGNGYSEGPMPGASDHQRTAARLD
jgi:DNA (cytosine-5)-methyltransferase 1